MTKFNKLTVQVLPPESSVATFNPLGRVVTLVSGTFNRLYAENVYSN